MPRCADESVACFDGRVAGNAPSQSPQWHIEAGEDQNDPGNDETCNRQWNGLRYPPIARPLATRVGTATPANAVICPPVSKGSAYDETCTGWW